MSPARFLDPTGQRYGIPTYPWGWAFTFDADLATRTQLAALGLRPNGQEAAAQLMWRSRRAGHSGVRTALLYRISRAKPKRPMTPGRERAVALALRARRTCPTCGLVFNYCIPTSLGQCPNCAYGLTPETWELEVAA
ncbi:hypothetical protein F4561_005610 [Lipingzhangella halophila]|uniref:Uncharacterized protein n=1 Tax=Lipingzhangella halophila TaxID=1783352 RepID=A0A7W7W0H7_9ACTN|nr:RRQRL motif-containing zinc-binding protein [Lipingzhangella halophila]MBB4929188.1 hypothetical protein [Lipingzhangella halophila]MBB4934716.1 hypothetical protein [Lipingzhangella halophila]